MTQLSSDCHHLMIWINADLVLKRFHRKDCATLIARPLECAIADNHLSCLFFFCNCYLESESFSKHELIGFMLFIFVSVESSYLVAPDLDEGHNNVSKSESKFQKFHFEAVLSTHVWELNWFAGSYMNIVITQWDSACNKFEKNSKIMKMKKWKFSTFHVRSHLSFSWNFKEETKLMLRKLAGSLCFYVIMDGPNNNRWFSRIKKLFWFT